MLHPNVEKAHQVPLSLTNDNHVVAMRNELLFLKTISKYPKLFTPGPVLTNAIRRYEKIFLPAIKSSNANHPLQGAPIDIEWVWHCHMLAPLAYHKDCEEVIGMIPDHTMLYQPNVFTNGSYAVSDEIRTIWERHAPKDEPLELNPTVVTEFEGSSGYKSQLSYDLVGAAERQGTFYYNVSLPHYGDSRFLSNAIHRYKMMLQLKTFHPNAFLVPCYDIDLAWHTHQLHPHLYKKDTTQYLGRLFNHDDNLTDRSADSHLTQSEEKTKQLWQQTYNQPFGLSGAMYRGVSPAGKLAVLAPQDNAVGADLLFTMELNTLRAVNNHAAKMRIDFHLGRDRIMKLKAKRTASNNEFNFQPFKRVFTSSKDYGKQLTLSLSQTEEGCCQSADELGLETIDFTRFMSIERVEPYEINIKANMGDSSLIVNGSVSPYKLGKVVLKLQAGLFSNVVMPETVESLWGPVPLGRLPPGAVNHCTVANHKLLVPGSETVMFTVRVVHCQPLLMSCVQVFLRDQMMAVSHLVGTDQIPDSHSTIVQNLSSCLYLKKSSGERAMLIKTANGDRVVLYGHWANMRKGVPGTQSRKGVPGNPGNLRVRLSAVNSYGHWVNMPDMDVHSDQVTIHGTKVNLKTGSVEITTAADVPEKLCTAFSVAVLSCLCQPPPPGLQPPKDACNLGVQPSPPKYRPVNRGNRRVNYNDGADYAFLLAAGWMMPSPSNYFIHHYWIHYNYRGSGCASGCASSCAGLSACAACGGFDGDGCTCAGDGGGCGGCGGGGGCGGDGGGCGGGCGGD